VKTAGLTGEADPDERSNWTGTAKRTVPGMLDFRCNIWRFKLLSDVQSNDPVITGHSRVELVEPDSNPRYRRNSVFDALPLSSKFPCPAKWRVAVSSGQER